MSDDPTSDEIRRARRGDREALNRLLGRTHDRLVRISQARLGERLRQKVRSSDILQSTYLEVMKAVSGFQGETEDEFVGWVTRIIENTIRDKGRYFDAKKRRVADQENLAGDQTLADPPDLRGRSPLSQIVAHEDLLIVDRAFECLAPDYQQALTLCVKEAHPHKEAAPLMGRSEAAMRVLLSRARAALLLEVDRLKSAGPGANPG